MYTPDANYECVAEHTLGLILSLLRKIPSQDSRIRRGQFDKKGFSGQELLGKTLGLVGFGRIARRLSELVAPFNVPVIVYHPSGTDETLAPHVSKVSSLDEVLRQSDIVSLHLPLLADTRGIIDSNALSKMKKHAYLINTSRGPIVNEKDLIKALHDGRIMGAALDTFEVEPMPADSPLFHLDNVVMTMHTAGNSDASLRNMAMGSARNVLAVLRNQPLDPRLVLN
jgi:D-3-phosphoglycerate dehydrogenase